MSPKLALLVGQQVALCLGPISHLASCVFKLTSLSGVEL